MYRMMFDHSYVGIRPGELLVPQSLWGGAIWMFVQVRAVNSGHDGE